MNDIRRAAWFANSVKVGKRAGLGLLTVGVTTALVVVVPAAPASAHVGDIEVINAKCVDATSMKATYKVGWTNGTATGKLYQRSGLHGQNGNAGNSTSGWNFVKDVSGTQSSNTEPTTFTITHAKSSFSGGNGPWQSSKVIFTDGYGVAADTRVENFDWSKCTPPTAKDASASLSITPATCDSPEKLVLGQAVNATWGTPSRTSGPGSYSVKATGNAGPPQHLFPAGSGVSSDGKTKTFTGNLKGKDTSKACTTPPPATKYTFKSTARCVTQKRGEGVITGRNFASSPKRIVVKAVYIRPNGSKGVIVATANPGQPFRIELPRLKVGSTVRTYVDGKLVDKDKVNRTKQCKPRAPHVGLPRAAAAG